MHRETGSWKMWIAPTAMMTCTLLSYIDRQVLAVLSPTILADTGLSQAQYTDAVSIFSIVYAVTNPIWGSILDYVGLRAGMLMAVAIWTLASASHAFVGTFLGFAIARAFLGLGEGAAFPGALRTAVEALPMNKQARGLALCYSGASLGALITPFLVTPLAKAYGWQFAFLITGALGLTWMGMWSAMARPPRLPLHQRSKMKFDWPDLRDRRTWVVMSSFGLGGLALGVVGYLSPLYLNRVMGLTQQEVSYVVWIPLVGWEIGYFFWGWVADRFASHTDRPKNIFLLLTVLSLPIAFVTLTDSLALTIALMFWATFVADGFVVLSLRVGSRIFPKERAGMVAGIGSGSWGLVQFFILPVYGRWFDRGWHTWCFVSMAILPAVGTLAWWWLSKPWEDGARRPEMVEVV
jgi:ACS family hexuronate transporter-like MFS transporter